MLITRLAFKDQCKVKIKTKDMILSDRQRKPFYLFRLPEKKFTVIAIVLIFEEFLLSPSVA